MALAIWTLLCTHNLESRLANRVQLTSDRHRPYLCAVEAVLTDQVDHVMPIKIYGAALRPRQAIASQMNRRGEAAVFTAIGTSMAGMENDKYGKNGAFERKN